MIRRHESGSQDRRERRTLGVAIRSLSVSHLFARVFVSTGRWCEASEVHTPDADPLCRSASPRAAARLSFISAGLRPPRKRLAHPALAWRRTANARRGREPTLATNGCRCTLFTRSDRSITLGRDSAGLCVLRRDVTRSGTRQQNGHAEWKKFIAVAGCSVNCFSRQRCEGKTSRLGALVFPPVSMRHCSYAASFFPGAFPPPLLRAGAPRMWRRQARASGRRVQLLQIPLRLQSRTNNRCVRWQRRQRCGGGRREEDIIFSRIN